MLTKILATMLLTGAAAAGGCAASQPAFSQQQVRAWAVRSEHLRQLNRLLNEPWPDEIEARRQAATSVGLW